MGITHLWPTLKSIGAVEEWRGTYGTLDIVNHVDGKAIAVDITIWMCEAMTQPQLREVFHSDTACVLKVCFDRCVQWLRFGCIPVAVLEGDSPQEKQQEIQKRLAARHGGEAWTFTVDFAGGRSEHLERLSQRVAKLFKALGLPVVQAPGEAEAMCAALQRHGLVHACATKDSDALVMGATRIYRNLQLNVVLQKTNVLEQCQLEPIRRWLGLSEGGAQALMLLALMVGGDYGLGTKDVGPIKALEFIKHALSGKQDDSDLLQNVEEMLLAHDSSQVSQVAKLTHCTGCKRCKHEGNHKGKVQKHTKKNVCSHPDCQSCDGSDGFFCTPSDGPCKCRFHTSELARKFVKVLTKLKTSDFLATAQIVEGAYLKQIRDADEAVRKLRTSGQVFEWQRRPDTSQVQTATFANGEGLEWGLPKVEGKLKLLHREWDLSHPSQDAVYTPKRINKIAGSIEAGGEDRRWAFLLDFLRNGKDDKEQDDVEEDVRANGEASARKPTASSFSRYVRKSLMHEFWPNLVELFEETQATAALKKKQKEEQAAARLARQDGKKQTTLDLFMRKSKAPNAATQKHESKPASSKPKVQAQVPKKKRNDQASVVNLISPDSSQPAPPQSKQGPPGNGDERIGREDRSGASQPTPSRSVKNAVQSSQTHQAHSVHDSPVYQMAQPSSSKAVLTAIIESRRRAHDAITSPESPGICVELDGEDLDKGALAEGKTNDGCASPTSTRRAASDSDPWEVFESQETPSSRSLPPSDFASPSKRQRTPVTAPTMLDSDVACQTRWATAPLDQRLSSPIAISSSPPDATQRHDPMGNVDCVRKQLLFGETENYAGVFSQKSHCPSILAGNSQPDYIDLTQGGSP